MLHVIAVVIIKKELESISYIKITSSNLLSVGTVLFIDGITQK